MSNTHESVMLSQALSGLNIQPGGIYIDATFGRGGHTREILSQLGPDGRLIVFDKDPQAIAYAEQLQQEDERIWVHHGSFKEMQTVCEQQHWMGQINGILFDLGVSSPQLDQAERGFSFLKEGPLDMRMDTSSGIPANEWLNTADEPDIAEVLSTYGEERFAKRIARAIVQHRVEQPLQTTTELSQLISNTVPFKDKFKHPATRSFQGIRIFINQELEDLKSALQAALAVLAPQGRLVVISFHSLEDRIVKQFIAHEASGDNFPKNMPVLPEQLSPTLKKISKKAVKPDEQEVQVNVRSRSAVMRVAEKLNKEPPQ